MKKDFGLTQEHFNNLLSWLSPDQNEAAQKYEEIRKGLIRFFLFKGCGDPEMLADETISRIAAKVLTFNADKGVKTITYFYGFASNIYLEYVSQLKKREVQFQPGLLLKNTQTHDPGANNEDETYDCLEDCLRKLAPEESKMVLEYYSKDKSAKLESRKQMADSLSLRPGTLHTKIHRIRNSLKKCIEECLHKKNCKERV